MDKKRHRKSYHLLSKTGKWKRLKHQSESGGSAEGSSSCDEQKPSSSSGVSCYPTTLSSSSPINPGFDALTQETNTDSTGDCNETVVVNEIFDFHSPVLYNSEDSDSTEDAVHSDAQDIRQNNPIFDEENTSTDASESEYGNLTKPSAAIIFLRQWALEENISLSSLSKLCKGLRTVHPQGFSNLPTDARTILKTPRNDLNIIVCPPGEYFHFGLKLQLNLALSVLSQPISNLYILFNVDGLPLFKSGKGELWPHFDGDSVDTRVKK